MGVGGGGGGFIEVATVGLLQGEEGEEGSL